MTNNGGDANYAEQTEKLVDFLEKFQDDDIHGQTVEKYMQILQSVANRRERVIEIELDDVWSHFGGDDMAEAIQRNTHRYRQLISEAIDRVMPEPTSELGEPDIADVLISSRMRGGGEDGMPAGMKRRYEVRVLPRTKEKAQPLRNVRASVLPGLNTVAPDLCTLADDATAAHAPAACRVGTSRSARC